MGRDSERGKYAAPEGSRTWEYLSASFCAIGMFCIGNLIGWNSPSLDELSGPDSPILIGPGDASTLAACISAGHIISLLLSVWIVDRIGRRNTILVSIPLLMVSWGLIAIARNATVLICARLICGVGLGLVITTCPIYMAEIFSSTIRGSLGASCGITHYFGVFFMFGVTSYLGVRITACVCLGFTMIFLICFWFIPESPYFLAMAGRLDEAENSLVKLRGKTDVADELVLIKTTLREKGKSLVESDELTEKEIIPKGQSAFRQLFTIRGNLKSFFIGFIGIILQHFCGFHVILYFCHIIIKDMGSQFDTYTASLIISISQVLSSALTIFTVDRFGRKPLLFASGAATTFFLATIATYFYLMEHVGTDVRQYAIVPLGSIFLLVMALNIGVMGVPATIQSEIYATDVKMLANCITGISGSFMTMFVTKFYLLMAQSWGLGHSVPFFGFAIMTALCLIFLMRWLPETKGKTLLQIQRELNS